MAYEVTKRIKGRDYRYRVEGFRDPETGQPRARWQYLGRLDRDGLVTPVRAAGPRVSREQLVAVTARLLESRDASRVTVGVIAQNAGVSAGTFYRHFVDRQSAFSAALAFLCNHVFSELPSLDEPIASRDEEIERLRAWFSALHSEVLSHRAFRWYLGVADAGKPALLDRALLTGDPFDVLTAYFRRLHAARLTSIGEPEGLAAGVMAIHRAAIQLTAARGDGNGVEWAAMFPVIERAVFG